MLQCFSASVLCCVELSCVVLCCGVVWCGVVCCTRELEYFIVMVWCGVWCAVVSTSELDNLRA